MTIAKKLEALRIKKGLNKKQVADSIEIPYTTYCNYESGTREPNSHMLIKLAKFHSTTVDDILNMKPSIDDLLEKIGAIPVGEMHMVPIVGSVKAGYNGIAYEEHLGYEPVDVKDPENYIFFKVKGDSMEPRIFAGDLALVKKQSDIESGDLAVVIVNGEYGAIKKVIKQNDAVVLQSFNPTYPPRIIMGEELKEFYIVGKVTKTQANW